MLILLILITVGVGIGAYNWGVNQGLEQSGNVEVVRYYGHGGFFPFGLFLFPLFIFGFFALMRGAFGGRHWSGPGHQGRSERLEEYHRQLHERETKGDSAPAGETGSA
jgi:hypothetical protein